MSDDEIISKDAGVTPKSTGLFTHVKKALLGKKHEHLDAEMDALKADAYAMIGAIQQMLDAGSLDDTTSQKLTTVITKLKTAMEKGTLNRGVLAMALAEAKTAVDAGTEKTTAEKQKTENLWMQVAADNKTLDDDFEKMHKAGIQFSDGLWNRHKELSEFLKAHPHDVTKQRELDAVDDALLHQAEPQINRHPEVRADFDEAKKTSEDRHKLVDKDLASTDKAFSKANDALASLDDVEIPNHNLGKKQNHLIQHR